MKERSYSGGAYRYGFNGQEMDDEVKGKGNTISFRYRIHDVRLGRFLSIDPLTKNYPMLTSYQFATNSPIAGNDLEGLEFLYYSAINFVYIRDPKLNNPTENEIKALTITIDPEGLYRRYRTLHNTLQQGTGIFLSSSNSSPKKSDVIYFTNQKQNVNVQKFNKKTGGYVTYKRVTNNPSGQRPTNTKPSVGGGILALLVEFQNYYFLEKQASAIDQARDLNNLEGAYVQKTIELVEKSISLGLIPDQLLNGEDLNGIASVILSDENFSKMYDDINSRDVAQLGKWLYDNRDQIMKGSYDDVIELQKSMPQLRGNSSRNNSGNESYDIENGKLIPEGECSN